MRNIARQRAGALKRAGEPDHIVAYVFISFGIEQRAASAAAGSPIFTDIFLSGGTEIFVELFGAQLAKLILVHNRNLGPLFGVIELSWVDVIQLALPELRALGVFEGDRFALMLNFIDGFR